MRTIEERIYGIIARVSEKPSQPVTPLRDLGCDSLDMVQIEMELEKEFGISFTPEARNRINGRMTAHDVVSLVEYEYLKNLKE